MQLTESSIFINLKKLRERLYGTQFHMNKADRIIYGAPLMEASGQSLGEFVLAFLLNGEKKLEHLECSIAWFTRLRVRQQLLNFGGKSCKKTQFITNDKLLHIPS